MAKEFLLNNKEITIKNKNKKHFSDMVVNNKLKDSQEFTFHLHSVQRIRYF